ncbi:reelin [Mytilus galloprovincialis]|uniref:Reelin n=1 Tax=Mytilus galloprovincialis TaxID=29158 RepID=A0A8B6HAQ7_MYTGA|nr:reelin [Mytilus galloprovincialis]
MSVPVDTNSPTLSPLRPDLASKESQGIVLRDDFDSSPDLDSNIWSSSDGVEVSKKCGTVMYGYSVTFCDQKGSREMVTVPLNTTTAAVLQFTLSGGKCFNQHHQDGDIVISVGLNGCSNWVEIDRVWSPTSSDSEVHLVPLPQKARLESVCFKWSQSAEFVNGGNEYLSILSDGPYTANDTDSNSSEVVSAKPGIKSTTESIAPIYRITNNIVTNRPIQTLPPFQPIGRGDKPMPTFQSCWAMDNVLIVNLHDLPTRLHEDFDPVDPSKWLFFPGANIRQKCRSDNNAMYFSQKNQTANFVVTRDLNLMPDDLSTDLILEEQFEFKEQIGWEVHGGRVDVTCGEIYKANSLVFDSSGDRKACTPYMDTRSAGNIRFYLGLGSGSCNGNISKSDRIDVLVYLEDKYDHTYVLQRLEFEYYQEPKLVSVPITGDHKISWARFCWIQKFHHGPNTDIWALDGVRILTHQPSGLSQNTNKTIQFGLNMQCGNDPKANKVDLQFSSDYGRTWHRLHTPCLPGSCHGNHQPISSTYGSVNIPRWKKMTLPLPYAAMSPHVRFRWRQTNRREPNWAIDNVYIGDCPERCNGHGFCTDQGCKCDFGYDGLTCNTNVVQNPTLLMENFEDDHILTSSSVMSVKGATISYMCGVLSSGKALVFSRNGQRKIVTSDFNTTNSSFWPINFKLSPCPPPDRPAETVILDYSCDAEVTWSFLKEFSSNQYRSPKSEMVLLPRNARKSSCRFRWWQPYHSGQGHDVWAIDGISLNHHLFNTLDVELESDTNATQHLVVNKGQITDGYCDGRRSVKGPVTKFRLRQSDWGPTDSWGISRLYIGQQCLNMCGGHGKCIEGVCHCDEGYVGEDCNPTAPMDSTMQADFGIRYEPSSDFLHIWGGEVTNGDKGCGTLFSGETLYFSGAGAREVQTKAFNTLTADYIEFYLRIGGNLPDCSGAETRDEGILLEYSVNGGTTWHLIQEMVPSQYRKSKFVHNVLPQAAKSPRTKFRLWQVKHSGAGRDQWAVDEIRIGSYERMRSLQDNFNNHADPVKSGKWLTITEGVRGKYCQARDYTLILANQQNDKSVVTKDLRLQTGDVIQFRINVGCSTQFRLDHPVMLQYSHDGGQTWRLVHEPCYQESDCNGLQTEGTIYYSGPHGSWQNIIIPVSETIAMHPVIFRWWQPGGYAFSFALNDVYIGPPCPENCNRRGTCENNRCICQDGFTGPTCADTSVTQYGLFDWFDNHHDPSNGWRRILGGSLGLKCGVVDHGNALYFSEDGTREAVTKPLNTTFLRMLQFVIKIGGNDGSFSCTDPSNRNEGVIVDYSTDNEITWTVLKMVEPRIYNTTKEFVTLDLPADAKTDHTIIRFWQPLGYGGLGRSEWGIDSVIVGVNETNAKTFYDDFNMMMPDPYKWLQAESAVARSSCQSGGNALEFSRDTGLRFASTQDLHVTPSTFLQFDIAMGCDSLYDNLYGVMLEYSIDMGQTWRPVIEECAPPKFECTGYHLSSEYMSDQHRNWTRVTTYLPAGAVSPTTRFRWKQSSSIPRGHVWALDNVYLGTGCPWLCSGHGYCRDDQCICDPGFSGQACIPSEPLPAILRDDFNTDTPRKDNWLELYGGGNTKLCGTVVSGNAMTFTEENMRLAVSRDIDSSMLQAVEFYFKYGCNGNEKFWPRSESVLLQYSINGGITWNLLKEINYRNQSEPKFFSIDLPVKAKTHATRFRFWQPRNEGKMLSAWAVDNLHIGKMPMNPFSLTDNFDGTSLSDEWLFINDGVVDSFCEHKTRQDTEGSGQSAMVFRHAPKSGEHYVVTKDLDVGPMSIVQFDINVGCGSKPSEKYPIRLEYSANGGKTWHPLVPNCAEVSSARCFDVDLSPSIYYGGTSAFWRRVIIPLDNVYVCGALRFRWYQGFVPDNDFAPEWAIDNIFIGMGCREHCLGHGACSDTMMCTCDEDHGGDMCSPWTRNSLYLKDNFTPVDVAIPLREFNEDDSHHGHRFNKKKWWIWSGARLSYHCDTFVSGPSLTFRNSGERVLTTRDLDLSTASLIQFFMRLGCKKTPPNLATFPVYLQYSNNGGVSWKSIQQFDFNKYSNRPTYIALHLPENARTNNTRIRWIQHSLNGTFLEDWAIDHIFIGGDMHGVEPLQDDPMLPRETSWLLFPGGNLENVCQSESKVIHFNGNSTVRYAMSGDVIVEDGSFMQFNVTMGCGPSKDCYHVEIQYSHDMGISWKNLQPACGQNDVDCKRFAPGSSLVSDVNIGWNRVTVPLPYYSKSKQTRFRWIQINHYKSDQVWALSHIYVGRDCYLMCSGHGHCSDTGCLCDKDWSGFSCEEPTITLPHYLYDTFSTSIVNSQLWKKVIGARVEQPCQVLAAGNALHFVEDCSRLLITTDIDLRQAKFIQFSFMFGCNSMPSNRNQGVLVDYSVDGGIKWMPIMELYYALYRSPKFVTVNLPQNARKNGVRIRWLQNESSNKQGADWLLDNVRIGGSLTNPNTLVSHFDSINDEEWLRSDNVQSDSYCGTSDVAMGAPLENEDSVLISRDVDVLDDHMLQYEINVGCGQPWNRSVLPVHLQYSTDDGLSWHYLTPQCLPSDPQCNGGPQMASLYHNEPMGMWRRFTYKLNGLPVSRGTRFRWTQKADRGSDNTHSWGLRNVFIGPACPGHCNGRGLCVIDRCDCDQGYTGSDCSILTDNNPTELKDNFENPNVNKSKWSLVEGGNIQKGCHDMVEDTAMVMGGPGNRQLVTVNLDLQSAKKVRYMFKVGTVVASHILTKDYTDGIWYSNWRSKFNSPEHSVVLQYSTNGGIDWKTLHVLSYGSYLHPKKDYIILPVDARSPNTLVRWWQGLAQDGSQKGPQWQIDNVFIGGSEINPSSMMTDFDNIQGDQSWEFSPYGKIQEDICTHHDKSMFWDSGAGSRSFTTGEMIVQYGYMLQFEIVVGCDRHVNACNPYPPIRLEYNKNPHSDQWSLLQPLCLPDHNTLMECQPSYYHAPSVYTPEGYPSWTLVTMELKDKVFSGNTRFRWKQDASEVDGTMWALNHMYVGEKCPDMCNGRGICKDGICHCQSGHGVSCRPVKFGMLRKMHETFEGRIYPRYWESITGGGIGFGCGALLPYAHGKTLYFNGCGLREARTAEMDLSRALKIMFVLQIGCKQQTVSCNVNVRAESYRGILLQYSTNKGAEWKLLARHDPSHYLNPKRAMYDLPSDAKVGGVQIRWWQPVHDGVGHDQWAIDSVEIIPDHNSYSSMLQRRKRRKA